MIVSNTLTQQCKKLLQEQYGSELRGLLLYGSAARGEETADSDIDLLVLLNRPFDYAQEVKRIVDLLYPVQLDSFQLISAKPAFYSDYEKGTIQLYRNAKKDGQLV